MTEPLIQPYDTIKEIAPDLYCLDGDWYKTSFRRRMTLIKLKTGDGLVVHSPIRLRDEDYSKLDRLGQVKIIIVPNAFHSSESHHFKSRYPAAQLYVSKGAVRELQQSTRVDGELPESWPTEYHSELECIEFQGTRMLFENLFFHRPSKTLIMTDLVFNMQNDAQGVERILFKLNGIYKHFGPSRLFKYAFAKDKIAIKSSLSLLMGYDFDRVIMSHGDILYSGGKAAIRDSFAELGY